MVLTNGDVDAVAGLLHLREGTPFALYAHARVHRRARRATRSSRCWTAELVPRRALEPEREALSSRDAAGEPLGSRCVPFAAPGKVPLYLEGDGRELDTAAETATRWAWRSRPAAGALVYLANCAAMTDGAAAARIGGRRLLFIDGTLWRDDEMIAQGVGSQDRAGAWAMSA